MEKEKWGVHVSHCCVLHRCKYGDEECPVKQKQVKQVYPCEFCDEEGFQNIEQIEEYVALQGYIEQAKEEGEEYITVRVDLLDRLMNGQGW